MNLKKYFLILFLLSFIFCLSNCSDPATKPPPPPVEQQRDTITVSLEQTTHRSISVRLSKKLKAKNNYVLNRISGTDTFSFVIFPLSSADTLIIDDNDGAGLTIDTEYGYFAYRVDSIGAAQDTSNTLIAHTLPPTSHDYTWTEYTMGSFPSAELYDVWGTDENNVYAVGGVKIGDSTVGIIRWNGIEWIPVTTQAGGYAIFGFAEDDIWVTGGGGAFHYDGSEWLHLENVPVLHENRPYTSIWGTSSNNLYFAGTHGRIVHWDGSKATLMETPTDILLTDIYGISNNFILAAGAELAAPGVGLVYNEKLWKEMEGLSFSTTLFYTVFAFNKKQYFIGGERNYINYGSGWEKMLPLFFDGTQKIRGNTETGDIVLVGSGAMIMHFNGVDWYNFKTHLNRSSVILWGVFLTDNKIFAVGNDGQTKAYIFIGRRN
ncbi:MAG: hypothetical protein H6627_10355 [Calditrichae bacterium]|nr:hypothetical protein [Calditrichia bacterium]